MEWQISLAVIFGSLLLLMAAGMPVVFCFWLLNIIGMFLWWGGEVGLQQFVHSMFDSVTKFSLLPIPFFILMGEVMFHAQIAIDMIDVLDSWLGRMPGRLALLAVGGGALFSTLSGSSLSSVAMLGSTLTPEMEKRGYKKEMSLGPILGSGGLALMIPPSSLAVLLGAIGEVSIGKILIGIVVPGLLMAAFYAAYIILRCWLRFDVAPPYHVSAVSLSERLLDTTKYIFPLGFIIFLVTGIIILGIATPTEAAACGAVGCFILAAGYRRLNRQVAIKSFSTTLEISVIILVIVTGAQAFSQNLAYIGASRGLSEFVVGLPVAPIVIILALMVVVTFLGMFMTAVPIMMIVLPVCMPVVIALGFDTTWFAVLFLLNLEMGTTSPPFGLNLFVMKSVAPEGTTMGDCYKAALPYLGCDALVMAVIMAFPQTVLWMPGLMR